MGWLALLRCSSAVHGEGRWLGPRSCSMKLPVELRLFHDVVHWRGRTRVPLLHGVFALAEEESHPSPPLPNPPGGVLNLSPDEDLVSVLLIGAQQCTIHSFDGDR